LLVPPETERANVNAVRSCAASVLIWALSSANKADSVCAATFVRRNLIIFVTARLVNPAGQPVKQTEEEEEMVEPPILREIPAYKK
jgi:hypothetical protein